MIAITGGGTGGHLSIAKAIANELKNNGEDLIFIGSQNGQDKFWFENDEVFGQKYFLSSSGVVNKKGFNKFKSAFNILKLSLACLKIFKKHKIKAVFSVGGYSSAPASIAAILSRKKFFIHEQNAIIGRLNLILKPFCVKFFSSYIQNPYDYPVNKKFFDTAKIRNELKTILFLGGSQGAKFINELALNLAPNLISKNIKIIHQCGKNEYEEVCQKYKNLGIEAEVFAFSKEIEKYMQKADLCISRSGASSLWELCANLLPSVFIPYPYAANNHQFFNAKFLQDKHLTQIYEQKDIKFDDFLENILKININQISLGLKDIISPCGAEKIVNEILKI